jgi:organic hydroperoxide reductase OsmC/OhrA
MKHHDYHVRITWTGNNGEGTRSYSTYRRDHLVEAEGKAPILASSDPHFRGDPTRYNPEELLVASLSSCHMLWYLHLCAVNQITVVEYSDSACGVMEEAADGTGKFVRVVLKPVVKISSGDHGKARKLHHEAHSKCFIANSVNFPVECEPEIS